MQALTEAERRELGRQSLAYDETLKEQQTHLSDLAQTASMSPFYFSYGAK